MIARLSFALVAASAALLAPTAASACDLDGMGGMHRMNPFAGMSFGHGGPMPPPPATEPASTRPEPGVKRSEPDAKEKAETKPLPVRKWEQQDDGAPVSAEDSGTFT